METIAYTKQAILFLISLMLAFASSAYAAPRIDRIDGEILDGNTVTLSGSSFTDATATPYLYDRVDNQPDLLNLNDGSVVPENKGPWTHNTSQWGNRVTISKSGDLRSANSKAVYFGSVKSYLGWPASMKESKNRSLYASWWFNPSQRADNGGSNKFVRVWDESSGEGTRISWTQMHMTYDGVSGSSQTNWGTTQPTPNLWNRMEIFVDSDDNSITTWLNGNVTHKVTDFNKRGSSKGLTIALVGFDPSINENYKNLNFRMTDIYISPNIARVEISDSPTWDLRNHREIQEVKSWSNNRIQIDLRLLSLSKSENLFLYVVDSDGNVNSSGYALTSCRLCPSEPKAVSVE